VNVGILAVHQSGYQARRDDLSLEELIYRGANALLDETGVSIDDVDHIAIASSDALDGRAISSMVTGGSVGVYFKDMVNCSSSGEHALIMALLETLSGRSRLALVANWGKPSETQMAAVDHLGFDPFFYRDLCIERTAMLALQARSYAEHARVTPELAARIAASARQQANQNSRSLQRPPMSAEAIAGSPEVASPLRAEELPPYADGMVAMLVGSEEMARQLGRPYVAIAGAGWAYDSYWSGSREMWRLSSAEASAQRAYRQARVSDPMRELDVVELMDVTPYHTLMVCEALGLCPPGEAAKFGERLAAGAVTPAVNPSGGLQAGNPDFAAGLNRVAEVYRQLTAGAEGYQVTGARRGVAHATSGFAAQVNSVFVLETQEA
jgi:acetyl-CoA C-acetyltransferase